MLENEILSDNLVVEGLLMNGNNLSHDSFYRVRKVFVDSLVRELSVKNDNILRREFAHLINLEIDRINGWRKYLKLFGVPAVTSSDILSRVHSKNKFGNSIYKRYLKRCGKYDDNISFFNVLRSKTSDNGYVTLSGQELNKLSNVRELLK